MTDKALAYSLPDDLGTVLIMPEVLAHFETHKQRRWISREAGGQLFARFDGARMVCIVEATGPRRTDKRSLFGYRPDRLAEKVEITQRYARDLHFVGDWHTHHQKYPEPSSTDEKNIGELVRLSSHGLSGFMLIVVGQEQFPKGLHVSFHSPSSSSVLTVSTQIDLEGAAHPEPHYGE